jgi:hypothetical protein
MDSGRSTASCILCMGPRALAGALRIPLLQTLDRGSRSAAEALDAFDASSEGREATSGRGGPHGRMGIDSECGMRDQPRSGVVKGQHGHRSSPADPKNTTAPSVLETKRIVLLRSAPAGSR